MWYDNKKILLASKSPRRQQLIKELGIPTDIIAIDVDESIDIATPLIAETLAKRKADAFKAHLSDNEILITADTIVSYGDKKLGKPHSRDEAFRMLSQLSGAKHTVFTGVCIKTSRKQTSFTELTHVWFRELSDEEISHYIDCYKPFDKAGAYGIQEWIGMIGIEHIEGCYYNVMGLPVARLYRELKELLSAQ